MQLWYKTWFWNTVPDKFHEKNSNRTGISSVNVFVDCTGWIVVGFIVDWIELVGCSSSSSSLFTRHSVDWIATLVLERCSELWISIFVIISRKFVQFRWTLSLGYLQENYVIWRRNNWILSEKFKNSGKMVVNVSLDSKNAMIRTEWMRSIILQFVWYHKFLRCVSREISLDLIWLY